MSSDPPAYESYPKGDTTATNPNYPVSGYPVTSPPQYGFATGQPSAAPPPGYGPPAYGPPPPPGVNVTVVPGSSVVVTRNLGSRSSPANCHSCHAYVTTNVNYEVGALTWLLCVGLIFVGCGWGCCFIPFCVDQCKDAVHTCPNCGAYIGRYNAL